MHSKEILEAALRLSESERILLITRILETCLLLNLASRSIDRIRSSNWNGDLRTSKGPSPLGTMEPRVSTPFSRSTRQTSGIMRGN